MKNSRKKLVCKFLHEFLHADFLYANLSVCLRWLILLMTIHCTHRVFLYNSKCGWCKIRNQHCGKRLFAVKEKTTYYTLTLTMIMLRSRTSCFVINDFLGCWQKHYFTCKLGCMFILYLPWLLFWNKFNVLACIAGAWTSGHCFFFSSDLFISNTHLKHVSLRVYFYTSVSRVFFSWNLCAIWRISIRETRV